MTGQQRVERVLRKRSALRASAWAATLLTAIAAASCGSTRQPLFVDHRHHAPPGAVAALSLAGNAAARCTGPRHEHLLSPRFEIAAPTYLRFDLRKAVNIDPAGGIGHPIVHYFACNGYAVEIIVALSGSGSDQLSRETELWQTTGLFEALSPDPNDRITLWTIADLLRVSPQERFVYGAALEISDGETLQLRFEPGGSDARLMLMYRLSL